MTTSLVEQDEEMDDEDALWIEIEGERLGVLDYNEVYGGVAEIETDDGERWYVADGHESAGNYVKDRWRDYDESELLELIGQERIVQMWLSGQSFEDFLDEYIRYDGPEAELASWDGAERSVDGASPALIEDLGFTPDVAYRT